MRISTLAVAGLALAAGITARHAWSGGEVVVEAPRARTGALRELATRVVEVAREPRRAVISPIEPIELDEVDPEIDELSPSDELSSIDELSPGAELSPIARFDRIGIADGSALHGEILDRDRRPIPGVKVTVEPSADGATAAIAYTDEQGRYQVPGMPGGVRMVTIDEVPDGFVPQAMTMFPRTLADQRLRPTVILHDLPVGRTFGGVLGGAADSQSDPGVSISSHCGVENTYIVEEPD